MLYYISGKLVVKEPTFVVIDVNGVGYEIKISLHTYSEIKSAESCKMFIYFQVKEDSHTLFGFLNINEKVLFTQIIGISGIGPSIGMMLFSSLSTIEIKEAILAENVKLIQSVKGIGAKTAQRLILELKDKISKGPLSDKEMTVTSGISNSKDKISEAMAALVALGINKSSAEKNLNSVVKKHGDQLSLEELIKLTLKTN